MDIIEILKIVKSKLFESRKKITIDDYGKRILENITNWEKINEKDTSILKDLEGWNVADKDYVDLRVNEIYQKIISIQPTAPPLENKKNSKTENKLYPNIPPVLNSIPAPQQKQMFFCFGESDTNGNIKFFAPGLLLKKGWIITDFNLIFDKTIDEEFILFMKNSSDEKSVQISTINNKSGNSLFSAETNLKIDITRAVLFEIKMSKKQTYRVNFQICITLS